jgi:hypothetical protein
MEEKRAYNDVAEKVILDFYKNYDNKSLCVSHGTVAEDLAVVLMTKIIKLIEKGDSGKYTNFAIRIIWLRSFMLVRF